MANNRELSQVAGFIIVDDSNRNIGIATTATPYVGIGTTNPQAKLHVIGDVLVSGVVTATTFNGQINAGVATITTLQGANAVFSGNVSIGGTLTYEDVTNIDAIGIVTARSDVIVGGGVSIVGVTTLASAGGITTSGGDVYVGRDLYVKRNVLANSGIATISGVTISSGIVTSANPGVTTIKYYGDGSNLIGVNAFNVINQDLTSSPVYPTFANNTGVSSVGISTNNIVFVPATGRLGIGTTNPQSTLQVGAAITMYGPVGIVSAVAFYGDGSKLTGVNAFNVIPQDLTASPVYPTFANNTGVSSVGIASTGFVYIPSTGSVGINSVQPAYKLDVGGDINISGTYRVNGRSVLDDALIYSIVFG
jgi:hypothetical protein